MLVGAGGTNGYQVKMFLRNKNSPFGVTYFTHFIEEMLLDND